MAVIHTLGNRKSNSQVLASNGLAYSVPENFSCGMNFASLFSAQGLLPGGNAMLVLSRKPGEKLVIGHEIIVTVLEVRGSQVKIGIEAPDNVKIIRAELKAAQPDATCQDASDVCRSPEESSEDLCLMVC
jgi:carbon storage regulator